MRRSLVAGLVYRAVLMVGATAVAGSASAITIYGTDGDYLVLGADSPFNATGRFNPTQLATTANGAVQSGVLVAPNWVLGIDHAGTPSTFAVGGATYSVTRKVSFETGSARTTATDGVDLALFELSASVGNVTPAELYTGSLADLVGQTVVYTGTGATGTGMSGGTITNDPSLRAGKNVIDGLGPAKGYANTIVFSDFDNAGALGPNSSGSSFPLDLEMAIAVGDSGGGVFFLDEGVYRLAAVHSFVTTPQQGQTVGVYGTVSFSTGFQSPDQMAFILATIPEPASLAMLACGVLAVASRRR